MAMGTTRAVAVDAEPSTPPGFSSAFNRDLPLDLVDPSPYQTRRFRDDGADLADLVRSIETSGVIQPVVVRSAAAGPRYELLAGERRCRASRLAGRTTVPAIVRDLTDAEAVQITVIENLQRQDLEPMEEAAGVRLLLDRDGWTLEAVAEEIGKSPAWVARRASLSRLAPAWQEAVRDPQQEFHRLGAGHLERIARLPEDFQLRLLEDDSDLWWSWEWDGRRNEQSFRTPTLRKLEHAIEAEMHLLSAAPWKVTDPEILPAAGACTSCPKRTGAAALLWEEEGKPSKDCCLDAECWSRKLAAAVLAKEAELRGQKTKFGVLKTGHGRSLAPGLDALAKRAVQDWDVQLVKGPKAPGAKPYLVVDGPEAGQVKWAKPRPSYSGSGAHKVDGPKPLKERKAALGRRRLKLAIEAAIEAFSAPELVMPAAHLYALLAVFGTKRNADQPGAAEAFGYDEDRAALALDDIRGSVMPIAETLMGRPPEVVDGLLWRSLLQVFRGRWVYYASVDVDRQWKEVEAVGRWLGVETAPFHAAAVAKLREPKAWQFLKADGSPKTAEPKAKRGAKA